MPYRTFKQRTHELETVKLALANGYNERSTNKTAIRHFGFMLWGAGLPDVDVSWFQGSDHASVTVGNTTTNDIHAVEILRDALTSR
jgi:hypothetical protein